MKYHCVSMSKDSMSKICCFVCVNYFVVFFLVLFLSLGISKCNGFSGWEEIIE